LRENFKEEDKKFVNFLREEYAKEDGAVELRHDAVDLAVQTNTHPKNGEIKTIINAVYTWRKNYVGEQGYRVGLEEGAMEVGYNKKTLDDFLY